MHLPRRRLDDTAQVIWNNVHSLSLGNATPLESGDITRARREIGDHIGTVSVEADAGEIRLYSDQGHVAAALLRAAN
jgi:hypothetical protein